MKILAIETSTDACSAALVIEQSYSHDHQIIPKKHTELILPMITQLLANAKLAINQLDAIAFGCGPGSFTGVRIALGVAQGLAYAHQLPLIPISSLNTMAQAYADQHKYIACAIDARMQEIYWMLFQCHQGLMQAIGEEQLLSPDQAHLPADTSWLAAGNGWQVYQQLGNRLKPNINDFKTTAYPFAIDMLPLAIAAFQTGKMVSAMDATPSYIRNKVALIK